MPDDGDYEVYEWPKTGQPDGERNAPQQYGTVAVLPPINPTRPGLVVHLCHGCGALVGDMQAHDRHHGRVGP